MVKLLLSYPEAAAGMRQAENGSDSSRPSSAGHGAESQECCGSGNPGSVRQWPERGQRLFGDGTPDAGAPFGGRDELHAGATARLLAEDTGYGVGQPGNEPCRDLLAVGAC